MSKRIFDLANIDDNTPRIAWSPETTELHMNVVHLRAHEVIPTHTNTSLDVIVTCLRGTGLANIDGEETPMQPGTITLIPKGSEREITAGNEGVVYTTVHARRGGLMPQSRIL
ncbi:MAG: cupin domain-containing protein [Thermomicrobiales bacterium]|nr:cupin domain-containing protein [Thermomicrobiales bacterium]